MVARSVYITATVVVVISVILGELYIYTLDKEIRAKNLRAQFICFLEFVIMMMSAVVWKTFGSRRSTSGSPGISSDPTEVPLSQQQRKKSDFFQSVRTSKKETSDGYQSLFMRSFLAIYLFSCHLAFFCNVFLMGENPHWLSLVTYGTFGSLIQLFTALVICEAVHFVLKFFCKRKKLFLIGNKRLRHFLVVSYAVLISTYGLFWATQPPVIKRVSIPIPKLPKSLEGFKIVQLTDIHLGPTVGKRHLETVVKMVNDLKPDILVMTGDLVDGTVEILRSAVEPMKDIKAVHEKFFITGNHEYYTGDVDHWFQHLTQLGYTVLHNSNVKLPRTGVKAAQQFCLAGVDDIDAVHMGYHGHGPDIVQALSSCDPTQPVIVLAHQPKVAKKILDSTYKVDLILSGHTHGGQMFPLMVGAYLINPFFAGLYHYKGQSYVYVSEGTVYWGIPMRIGSTMEITEITLTSR